MDEDPSKQWWQHLERGRSNVVRQGQQGAAVTVIRVSASRRRLVSLFAVACSALALPARPSRAAGFPSRPVKLLVGSAPGGPSDFLARLFAEAAGPALGQSVVVDNRPGAGGTLAAESAARSEPDGHTLLVAGASSVIVAPYLIPKLSFTPASFMPVAMLGVGALVLAVHPSVPAKNLRELIAHIRSHPDKLAFGSGGNGSAGHLCAELFSQLIEARMLHVPYKGDGPAMNDLLGGQVQLLFTAPNVVAPHAKSGRLRVIAVTSRDRHSSMPDIPTVRESTLTDFEYLGWIMLLAPAGTPHAAIERLAAAWSQARIQGTVKSRLDELGMAASERFASNDDLNAFLEVENSRLAKVIRGTNVKAD